jgi:RimJ/RimL family protein N-acetyltransferase
MKSIKIRSVEINDFAAIKEYITSADVAEYLTWQPYINEDLITEYFLKIRKANSFPNETLVIEYDGRVIGTIHFIFREKKCTQFGFGILPVYWNKGIGDKVVKLSLEYFFKSEWAKHSHIIWADVHRLNKFAIKVLQNNGFSLSKKSIEHNRNRYLIIYDSK